jgi:hypothetical protein
MRWRKTLPPTGKSCPHFFCSSRRQPPAGNIRKKPGDRLTAFFLSIFKASAGGAKKAGESIKEWHAPC